MKKQNVMCSKHLSSLQKINVINELFACWKTLSSALLMLIFFFFLQNILSQEYHQSVKQFGFRSDPTSCRA